MEKVVRLGLFTLAILISGLHLAAQPATERVFFNGAKLTEGLDMGVNTSGGRTNWVSPDAGAMKMAYPADQAWGAVFITVGAPREKPRPSWDLSACASLLVEVRGDPGSTVEIGIKDSRQEDDGKEQKVIVPLFSSYRTYAIPLRKFSAPTLINPADLKSIYVVAEFVFGGAQAQTVWFRNLKCTSAAAPDVESVVHGASFRSGAGAGSWVSLIGRDLSPVARGWAGGDFLGAKLPRSLDGVSVNVNDRDMAVAYVSAAQINTLFLHDIKADQSYVSVTNALGTSVPVRVVVQAAYPAFFVLSPQAGRYAAAVHVDGTLVCRPNLFEASVVCRPAKPGDVIQIFGTGFGPTSPVTVADEVVPAPVPLSASANLNIRLGTTAATVEYAGLIAPGLYQFNLRIPGVADGDQRLTVDLGNVSMQQEVYLTIQR